MAVALEGLAGHVDGKRHRIVERLETAVVTAVFGQFEEAALRVLDLRLRRHVERRVEGDVDHVFADGDQRAAQRQVVDRPAVVLGIDDRHGFGGEAGEILCHRQVADLVVGGQEGLDRHRVGGLAHADDVAGDLEDLAVQGFVEMDGLQKVGDAVIGVVIDQDRAEQSLFGLDIVRGFAVMRLCRLDVGELAYCVVHGLLSVLSCCQAVGSSESRGVPKCFSSLPTVIHRLPTKLRRTARIRLTVAIGDRRRGAPSYTLKRDKKTPGPLQAGRSLKCLGKTTIIRRRRDRRLPDRRSLPDAGHLHRRRRWRRPR